MPNAERGVTVHRWSDRPLRGRGSRVAVLFALGLVLGPAAASAEGEAMRRTISVSAEGSVTAVPDLAVVSFAVETAAPQAARAVEENAGKSASVAGAVKPQLGETDKLTTTRYSLDPTYERREAGSPAPPRISGYVARNEVRVETGRIDHVGELIDLATKAGANRVNGLEFTLRDRAPWLRKALLEAGREARQQAEVVAQALGVRLLRVVDASTSGGPIVLPRQQQRVGMAAMESVTTPVEPGDIVVRATLQVTYEIE